MILIITEKDKLNCFLNITKNLSTFFNSKYVSDQLQYGREYIFYGAVSGDFIGYNMTNPVFESMDAAPVTTRRVLPIYPLTAGLTNAALLKAVRQALAICDPPPEILPEDHVFYQMPNVLMTPHIAGSLNDEVHRMAQYMIEEYSRVMAGETPLYEVSWKMLETMA